MVDGDNAAIEGMSAANAETVAIDAKVDNARVAALSRTLFLIYTPPANPMACCNQSATLIPHNSDGRSMSADAAGTIG